MSPKKEVPKPSRSLTATGRPSGGFTDEERAAMEDRARELNAEAREQERGEDWRAREESGDLRGKDVMSEHNISRISGHIVLGLSLFAMLLVVGATILTMLGRFNPSATGDEGTAAHLFQLTIVLLVPAGLTFLVTADWRQPTRAARRLVIPAVALVIAFSMLYYMEHIR